MSPSTGSELEQEAKTTIKLDAATVRFAGDSGDGMQLAGTQFSNTSALAGNDIATFPDFPAEIRAPRGTLAGVSGFQVHFASQDILTPGDELDALVAMNPAALRTNIMDLQAGGILICNENAFDKKSLEQAEYKTNPLEDGSLDAYQLFKVPMTDLTRRAVEGLGLSQKEADRCRNFFAMGLVFWLYGRSLEPTQRYIDARFGAKPEIAEANHRALRAGYNYGDITEAFASSFRVEKAQLPAGTYRSVMGNVALAWGLMAAARLSGKELFLGSYPITPASDILHELSRYKNFGVRTFQAEDEIAAITSCIGASFGGAMAVTTSSGPGIALKTEALGLGCMLELPMIVINIQRGGPSTGLPTKTEQADLFQAIVGRNGEAPLPVLAARSPSDCFDVALEAWRIATRYMVPVFLLSDGYIANGSEPWRIPKFSDLQPIPVSHPTMSENGMPFLPYRRDERLSRPWAIPGTPGLMHRIGGLEKQHETGNVSYDPKNHEKMVEIRQKKIEGIALDIPLQEVDGPATGELLVLSWGGTYGACITAVRRAQQLGCSVAHAHLRYLHPFPRNLGDILRNYRKVLIPELNMGQLRTLIRAKYLVDARGYNKVQGRPFTVKEVLARIQEEIKVMSTDLKVLTPADFQSDQDVRWCPGCGDYSILAQMKKVLPTLNIPKEKLVFISGIGCSSRFPYYVDTYGVHGIHGRAPAIATGLKAVRPDLCVWVITGDGDGLSIGGNHLMHAIRRNLDINIILFNNRIYGLTKGQYSPTSPLGQVTKSTPMGAIDNPLHPLSIAIGCEATFVARSIDVHIKHLGMVLTRAAEHRGTSFVEVYQNCNVFNDGAWDYATDKVAKFDNVLELEHGKPLVFGKDRNKGIRLNGLEPEIVELGKGITEDDLLFHDERAKEPSLAYLLSRMRYPEFPEPIGVFRAVDAPRYEEQLNQQIADAKKKSGEGDFDKLFFGGETWEVN